MLSVRGVYIKIAAIAVASAAMVLWLPAGEVIQYLAAVPLVGSLVAALLQILRDEAAYERSRLLQESQNRFSLGAASHMASVAFDKHVQFCEEYVAEVHSTFDTLFREGPTEKALSHTVKLYGLQKKYAVWLTPEIGKNLELFESAVRQMAATAGYHKSLEIGDERQRVVAEMFKTFANIMGSQHMGHEWNGEPLNDELAVAMVIHRLRRILGTEELTSLRASILSVVHSGVSTGG